MACPIRQTDAVRLGIVTISVLCVTLGLFEYLDLFNLSATETTHIAKQIYTKQANSKSIFGKAKRKINVTKHNILAKKKISYGETESLEIHEYGSQTRMTSGQPQGFFQVNDENIYIFSAFLDTRFRTYFIRMFGMQTQNVTSVVSCELLFNNGTSVNVIPEISYAIHQDWPSPKLKYIAYYYGCELRGKPVVPDDVRFHLFVQGSNLRTPLPLTTIGRALDEDRGTLAVCVKAIWGNLDPRRLVEWIETNRELGVEKFVFYDRALVGAAARVLRHYSDRGIIEVTKFAYALQMATLMADDPMKVKLLREDLLLEQAYLVSMNDCYYRLRDRFKYVLLIDVDEVLVPVNNEPLPAMIARTKHHEAKATSFVFPVAWHFGEFDEVTSSGGVPNFMYMQHHLRRTHVMNPANDQPKAVFHTDRSVSISWHGTRRMPINFGYEMNVHMKWSDYGFLHHFRDKCVEKYVLNECQFMKRMSEVDDVIPRLAHVSGRVELVLRELRLLYK